jgi:hypothetical protein
MWKFSVEEVTLVPVRRERADVPVSGPYLLRSGGAV